MHGWLHTCTDMHSNYCLPITVTLLDPAISITWLPRTLIVFRSHYKSLQENSWTRTKDWAFRV